jgi:hypothetical protein
MPAGIMQKAISGTLQGGERLKRHLKEIEQQMGQGAVVVVGFLESATYPAKGKSSTPVAQVAFWNEYGTSRTPSRPFFRTMIASKSPRWGIGLGIALRKTNYNARNALAIMGEGIRGQLRQSIRDWSTPPNSPRTVARKGFNKPLIETALMIRSADYQVIDGDISEEA